MTTWGGFGLIVCTFMITPIVILIHSRIPSKRFPIIGFPIIAIGCYLGITVGVMIFSMMGGYFEPLPVIWFIACIPISIAFAVPTTVIITFAKRRMEKQRLARSEDIQSTINRLKAKGTIHAPKGPYKHKNWRQPSTDHISDHETQPPRHGGYYGT